MSFVDLAKYTKTDILAPYLVLKERCKILQKNEGEGRYIIEVFTNHGRFVLKICDIELKKYKADPTVYQQRRSAILLEADNMARFSKYNHFVKIIRKVQNKKSLELLMEYCGKSLIDKIKDDGSVLSQYNLVSWMSQTIIGMRYLEKNRMHHGDIKPENLLILDDHINITDLGESSEIESGFERTLRIGKKTVLKGYTEAYAPPEVLNQTIKDRFMQADVYSLGVTFWIMIKYTNDPHEGKLFYANFIRESKSRRENNHEEFENMVLNTKHKTEAEVTEKLIPILHAMVKKNPKERPKFKVLELLFRAYYKISKQTLYQILDDIPAYNEATKPSHFQELGKKIGINWKEMDEIRDEKDLQEFESDSEDDEDEIEPTVYALPIGFEKKCSEEDEKIEEEEKLSEEKKEECSDHTQIKELEMWKDYNLMEIIESENLSKFKNIFKVRDRNGEFFIIKRVIVNPEEGRKQFEMMKYLSQLTDQCVKAIAYEEMNKNIYLLLEFWGDSLSFVKQQKRNYILKHDPLLRTFDLDEEFWPWLQESLKVFHFGEENKLYFGDIKCDNILLKDGKIKITDLDTTFKYKDELEIDFDPKAFTKEYAAPEILEIVEAEESTITHAMPTKIDTYSFGMVLFDLLFLCTKEFLLALREMSHSKFEKLIRDSKFHLGLANEAEGEKMKTIILECLRKEPAARPSFNMLRFFAEDFSRISPSELHQYIRGELPIPPLTFKLMKGESKPRALHRIVKVLTNEVIEVQDPFKPTAVWRYPLRGQELIRPDSRQILTLSNRLFILGGFLCDDESEEVYDDVLELIKRDNSDSVIPIFTAPTPEEIAAEDEELERKREEEFYLMQEQRRKAQAEAIQRKQKKQIEKEFSKEEEKRIEEVENSEEEEKSMLEMDKREESKSEVRLEEEKREEEEIEKAGGEKAYYHVEKKPSMLFKRGHLGLAADHDCIYVCGGFGEKDHFLSQCEYYQIKYRKWNILPNMLQPKMGPACAVCHDYLYAFGGGFLDMEDTSEGYKYGQYLIQRLKIIPLIEEQWESLQLKLQDSVYHEGQLAQEACDYGGTLNGGACTIDENQIIIFGGISKQNKILDDDRCFMFNTQICEMQCLKGLEGHIDQYTYGMNIGNKEIFVWSNGYDDPLLFHYNLETKEWEGEDFRTEEQKENDEQIELEEFKQE